MSQNDINIVNDGYNKNYIFISYSHKDTEKVQEIIGILKDSGLKVWSDHRLTPAKEWDDMLAYRIEHCSHFFAFISSNYLESGNCKDELYYARELDVKKVLVYIEEIDLPGSIKMRLGRLQALFYTSEEDKKIFCQKIPEIDEISACRNEAEENLGEDVELFNRAFKEMQNPNSSLSQKAIFNMFTQSARNGYPPANVMLGVCYENGLGVEQNLQQAFNCYADAVKANDSDAMNRLASFYMCGLCIKQDENQAVSLYERSASLGNAEGQNNLGHCYEWGIGKEQSDQMAFAQYQKSAEGGYAEGQANLARCYEEGIGVLPDPEKASYWQKKANENQGATQYILAR